MLLLLLVFAAVFPFVYPLRNGKPLLSLEKIRLPALPRVSLPDNPLSQTDREAGSGAVIVYKWRDAGGNWRYSSEPPQTVSYETVELDPNANLIQGMPTAAAPSSIAAQPDTEEMSFGYTPEKIGAMMEKARQARNALQARNQALEGLDQ